MLLLLTGHPRSGTELLTRLLNSHPEVAVTLELGTLRTLWVPPKLFAVALLESFRGRPFPIRPDSKGNWEGWRAWGESYRFLGRLIWSLRDFRYRDIGPRELEACYQRITGRTVVGDKLPAYSQSLDQFALVEGLKCIVIYRHLFSVTRSYLELVEGSWRNVPTLNSLRTPRDIASQWAAGVRVLKKHWQRVLPICYETLCDQPETEVSRLARWMEVEASGFDKSLIQEPRPLPTFTPEQVEDMLSVAGPELEFLGYNV